MKKEPKVKKFYKVVNPNGHRGFVYKLGENTDTDNRPLSSVESCSPGALYFTDAENLHQWLGFGSKVAILTAETYLPDGKNKFKAKTINILEFVDKTFDNLIKIPKVNKTALCDYFEVPEKEARKILNEDELVSYLVAVDKVRAAAKELIKIHAKSPARAERHIQKIVNFEGYDILEHLRDLGRLDLIPFENILNVDWKVKQVKKLMEIHGTDKVLKELLNILM